MSDSPDRSAGVAALRAAFDGAFAAPAVVAGARRHELMAIGVGAQDLAVRLSRIARIEPLRRCALVPGARAHLAGLAASQDRLYALFSLPSLLGQASDAPQPWMMLVAGNDSVALAFTRFAGLLRVDNGALSRARDADGARLLIPELVRAGDRVRGVLDLDAVLEEIGRGVGRSGDGGG